MSVYLLALHLATAPYTAQPHIGVPPTGKRALHVAPAPRVVRTERGVASVYSEPQRTAWGTWYDGTGWVTAHRTAPRGSRLRVTCVATGRSAVLTTCDRGPYVRGRIVDISPGAARAIGLPGHGHQRLGRVVVEHLR